MTQLGSQLCYANLAIEPNAEKDIETYETFRRFAVLTHDITVPNVIS